MIIIILIMIIITIIIINNNDSNNSLRIIITVLLYSKIIRTRRIRVEFNVLQWIYWVELQKMKILVRLSMNTLKGGHITLIKFVCLSSPKIIYTACLINGGNFSIFHTQMPVILKVSVKWCLFDGILFNKTPMGRLVAVKSRLKSFSATCVSFSGCFAWKKKTYIHLITLNTIFRLGTERSKCSRSYIMFPYFAPSNSAWSTKIFSRGAKSHMTKTSKLDFFSLRIFPTTNLLLKPCPFSRTSSS